MNNKLLYNLIEQYLQHKQILEIFKNDGETDEGKDFLEKHSLKANALFWVLYSTYGGDKMWKKIDEFNKAKQER
jgi:hypothetical protein